jgi:hypothetical protein
MRRRLAWLGGLLALGALLGWWLRPAPLVVEPGGLVIQLTLAPSADLQGGYTFCLQETADGGARWGGDLAPFGEADGTFDFVALDAHVLAPEEFRSFVASLDRAGLWTIPNGEEAGASLYTSLVTVQGQRTHSASWAGLPTPAHRALASAFLNGPAGEAISQGLAEMRLRAARH